MPKRTPLIMACSIAALVALAATTLPGQADASASVTSLDPDLVQVVRQVEADERQAAAHAARQAMERQIVAYAEQVEQQRQLEKFYAGVAEAERLEAERVAAEEAARREAARREAAAKQAREASAAAATAKAAPAPNPAPVGGNRGLGQSMAANKGWTGEQWNCLDALWTKESGWNHTISNQQGSGAYGIPQALPGSKMASHGADWRTNPATQIAWGLDYIAGRYGTPCGAWNHSKAKNWY